VGTTSLVLGLVFYLFGFSLVGLVLLSSQPTADDWYDSLFGSFIIAIPLIIVGSLLLRKYDRDKKKENLI